MKLYYDLHIHTAASHCADKTMRPHDIAAMAKLKELDIISVIDHVCTKNLRMAAKAANQFNLLFLPGIEVTTKENVHMLCYFKEIDDAIRFGDMIYDSLPDIKNDPEFWGFQHIFDDQDNIIGEVEKSLSSCTPFSVWETIGLVQQYGGVIVPAHINRENHGLLGEYDDISEFNFNTVEIKKLTPIDNKHIKDKKIVYNSDSHSITHIFERKNFIDVSEKSVEAVFNYLKY